MQMQPLRVVLDKQFATFFMLEAAAAQVKAPRCSASSSTRNTGSMRTEGHADK
jgi:hypothetical protein